MTKALSGSFKDYYFVSIHRYGTNIEHKHAPNPEPLLCCLLLGFIPNPEETKVL